MKSRPIVKHPDLHLFATHVARRLGCTRVVDLGCAQPGELAKVHPKAEVIGLGIDVDLRAARSDYRFARWMNWKLHVARHNTAAYAPAPPAGRHSYTLPRPELYNLATLVRPGTVGTTPKNRSGGTATPRSCRSRSWPTRQRTAWGR